MSTAAVKSNDRHNSQKFWPLKKFNLHNHGKTVDQQELQLRQAVLSPPLRPRKLDAASVNGKPCSKLSFTISDIVFLKAAKITTEEDTQKKSKNKRLRLEYDLFYIES
jgi:hypothetical protein